VILRTDGIGRAYQRAADMSKTKKQTKWPEKMKLSQARRYLGISFTKMTTLVKSGRLTYETSALDCRVKLVKRADLEALKRGFSEALGE
jgi:hypothetical protein